ncbi:MAG: glutamate--tRNA ligase [Planctomycetota bacterium]|jgi:glutamyl-tRNA synthetase
MSEVRVRFAPSPTGFLHIGGARTALYNWLHARHTGGKFLLRIEDTDRERHSEEAVEAIKKGMTWLGLDWDEEIVFQSSRLERYQEVARQLEESGVAYRSTKGAADKGEALVYKVPVQSARIEFDDQVLGKVSFQDEVIEDFTIMRSSGWPTYNFSCVVDDHDMGITDVIRGLDHVSNTPRQVLVHQGLGWEPPRYAHIPMITNSEGKKYSKRDGAVAVGDYAERGYLPEAFVNYMALLGWSPGGDVEIMSREEMAGRFTLDRVRKTPSQFDTEKFEWMNGRYIAELSTAELTDRLLPFVERAGLDHAARGREWLEKLVALMTERVRTLANFPELARYFFTDEYETNKKAAKILRKEGASSALERSLGVLEALEAWTPEALEAAIRELCEQMDVGLGKVCQPIRAAVTGTNVSPGLFEVLELLGRNETLARIRRVISAGT